MSFHLDHAVIAVHDLDATIQDYHSLGFTVVQGGTHANRATHNALITFSNGTYLELLTATHQPPLPGMIDFSILLRHGEGLVGFALRSNDLDADAARLRADGFAVNEVIPGERRREDGTLVRWKLALLDDGFAPFLIQDITPQERRISTDPSVTTHANAALGLCGVEIAVHDLRETREWYARLFSSTPKLEGANSPVLLREVPPAGLFALHLVLDGSETVHFPLERTHHVRFLPLSSSDS
jgi:catechol 2,3-dioxygenase-like lactoylglutathione lyase family enzyme